MGLVGVIVGDTVEEVGALVGNLVGVAVGNLVGVAVGIRVGCREGGLVVVVASINTSISSI